jgi:hypothetical protein
MRHLPPDAIELAERQHSTIGRGQLIALGYPPTTIDRWRHVGVLATMFPGQYRIAGAAEDPLQQLVAEIRRCGTGARLGGPLALALHSIEGLHFDNPHHVAIPPHRKVVYGGRNVVRSTIPEIDQAEACGIPTVTVERALIDAAAVYPRGQIRRAYYFAKRNGLVKQQRLRARARALRRVAGAPEMRALISTGALGMDSEGEWNFIDRVFRPGDPLPHPQVHVAWRDRTFRLDFAYLDARLDLEYNSRQFHQESFDQDGDADRQLALAELQIQTLPITAAMLRRPARTRERILAVRRQRLALGLPPITPLRR